MPLAPDVRARLDDEAELLAGGALGEALAQRELALAVFRAFEREGRGLEERRLDRAFGERRVVTEAHHLGLGAERLPRDVHPFYIGTQAHPELRSRPTRSHPLFRGLITAALDRLTAGRTTIVITHDLDAARSADRIVWVDAGRVTDVGRPDEVLARHAGELDDALRPRHEGGVASAVGS